VARHRDARERALVVLGLEAEVALDHHDDLARRERQALPDRVDVPLDERELLLGLL